MTVVPRPALAGLRTRLRALMAPTRRHTLDCEVRAYCQAVIADTEARLADLERRAAELRKDKAA